MKYLLLFLWGGLIGSISAFLLVSLNEKSPLGLLVAGSLFGIGLGAVWGLQKGLFSMPRNISASWLFPIVCSASFTAAVPLSAALDITSLCIRAGHTNCFSLVPFAISGFVTSVFMMYCIRGMTRMYTHADAWLIGTFGGILAGIFASVAFFGLIQGLELANKSEPYNWIVFLASWQSFMMLAVGAPLLQVSKVLYRKWMIIGISIAAIIFVLIELGIWFSFLTPGM